MNHPIPRPLSAPHVTKPILFGDDATFAVVQSPAQGSWELTAQQRRIVAAIGPGSTLTQIAEATGLAPLMVGLQLRALCDAGVLRRVTRSGPPHALEAPEAPFRPRLESGTEPRPTRPPVDAAQGLGRHPKDAAAPRLDAAHVADHSAAELTGSAGIG